jgi:hypothetical protein
MKKCSTKKRKKIHTPLPLWNILFLPNDHIKHAISILIGLTG